MFQRMVIVFFACFCAACAGDTVASVNKNVITRADFTAALQIAAQDEDPIRLQDPTHLAEFKRGVLNQLIDQELVAQKAKNAGVTIPPEELKAYLDEHKGQYTDDAFAQMLASKGIERDAWEMARTRQLLIDRYAAQTLGAQTNVKDAEIAQYYRAHQKDFVEPEAVHIRQILTETESTAREVHTKIVNGGNFAALAVEFSIAPEAAQGGDLGWIAHGQFPAVFEEHCFKLPIGAVSDVIQSPYGFHVFKILERRGARTPPLASVREQIRAQLRQDVLGVTYLETIRELRTTARIKIQDDAVARVALPQLALQQP